MASKTVKSNSETNSLYRDTLDNCEKARYLEKIAFIDDKDPLDSAEVKSWPRNCEEILPNVSYFDMLNYLVFNTSSYTRDQFKCYKGLDAYNQFVSGCVSDWAAYQCKDNKHIAVSAKVLHSQKLRENPLRPWIVAERGGEIVSSHCNCQAGLEVCTHVSALLFSIEAIVRNRDAKTVTEKPVYWKVPAEMKTVEYSMVYEMELTSAQGMKKKLDNKNANSDTTATPCAATSTKPPAPSVLPPTDDEMNAFYNELFNTGTMPVVLSTLEPYCDSFIPGVVSEEFPRTLMHIVKQEGQDGPKSLT